MKGEEIVEIVSLGGDTSISLVVELMCSKEAISFMNYYSFYDMLQSNSDTWT